MITCPECSHQELDGTIFCSHCGAPLLGEDLTTSRTVTLPFVDSPASPTPPPLIGKKSGPASQAAVIRFVIPVSGRQITLEAKDQLQIGRSDPRRDSYPDLDLTIDGGAEAGISRLHAVISSTAQGVAIMDLNSVNGTQINNYRIPPHLPFALNSGDELKLGTMLIHVFFED